eukprot:gene22305-15390_t
MTTVASSGPAVHFPSSLGKDNQGDEGMQMAAGKIQEYPRIVHLTRCPSGGFGFEIIGDGPFYVQKVHSTAHAANLERGDRILAINRERVNNLDNDSHSMERTMERYLGDKIALHVIRAQGELDNLEEGRVADLAEDDDSKTYLELPFQVTLLGFDAVRDPCNRWTMKHVQDIVDRYKFGLKSWGVVAPKHVYLFVLHDCLRIVNTKGLIVAQQRLDEIEFTGKTGPGKGDMLVMVTKDRETHHCHTIATPSGEATELLKAIKASLKARPVTPPRDTLQAQKKSSKGGGTPKRRSHKKEMTPDYNSRSRFEVDSEDGMEILRDCDYLEGMQARVSNWISEAGVSSGKVKRALLCAKSSRNNSPAHRGAAKIHASLMARLENEQAHTEDLLHGNANTPMMGPTDAHPTSPTHRVPSYSLSPTHRVSSGPQGETATPVPRKPVGMSEIDEQNVVRKQHFMHVPPITPPKATTLKQVSPR